MDENLNVRYSKKSPDGFKFLEPSAGIVEILILSKDSKITPRSLENFHKKNCVYFLVKESVFCDPIKYFFIDNINKLGKDINVIYNEDYKKYRFELYVGKTKDLNSRFSGGHNKVFWEYTIMVRSRLDGGFTDQEIGYLERYYYNKFKDDVYIKRHNQIKPPGGELSRTEYIVVNKYIKQIDDILYIINKNIFNLYRKQFKLSDKKAGIEAKAYIIDDKKTIVLAGSQATEKTSEKASESSKRKRKELCNKNILQLDKGKYVFNKDYVFTSMSGAAEAILGYNKNGKKIWKKQ